MQATQPHSLWQGRSTVSGSRRLGLTFTLALAALVAVFAMAIAASAQAEVPNVAAWGFNNQGELGNGTETAGSVPVAVKELSGVAAVSAGSTHGLALLEGGTVVAWGRNNGGQLGDGTTENRLAPVAVKELTGVTAVSAGGNDSLALLGDGTVMAWGQTQASTVPVKVTGLKEVTAIAAGGDGFGLALLKNGTVMAWGANSSGELGNGTTEASNVPVAVKGLSGVTAIAAGGETSLALQKSGSLMAWGRNSSGQFGDGTLTSRDVPTRTLIAEVTAIAEGSDFSLGLLGSGKLLAWGRNGSGQLGFGPKPGPEPCGEAPPFSCAKEPMEVTGLSEVTAIAAGGEHALALLAGGTLMAWGGNAQGQLGDGTKAGPEACTAESPCSNTPVAVCAEGLEAPCPSGPYLSHVEGIAAGEKFSLAVGAPPAVTQVEPDAGLVSGGTTVTITGAELTGATEVKFGSTSAASFTVNSDTSITAVSPGGTGVVDVTVTNPNWGASATSPADKFTYVAPGPAPTIKKVSPRKGSIAGGTSVTITGANFTGVTAVEFGSTKATSFTVNSATSVTAVSPAHAREKVAVTVTTPNGTSTSTITRADHFKYFRPRY